MALVAQRRAEAAGLNPARFDAHSVHADFVTHTGKADIPLERARDLSGYRSAGVACDYCHRSALAEHPAAHVFE